MIKYITFASIKAHKPCAGQLRRIRRLFGRRKRIAVTVRAAQAVASWADFGWLARYTLSVPARADYDKATAPAWADYNKACAPAWAAAHMGQ